MTTASAWLGERSPAWNLRTCRRTLAGAVLVLMIGLISHGHYGASGDALHYMVAAHSVAFDFDLDLSNDYGDESAIIQAPSEGHARLGRNGVLRPVHDPGLPFVAAPAFRVAYALAQWSDALPASIRQRAKLDRFIALRQLVGLMMILATTALALVLFELTYELTGNARLGLLWSLVCVLSPPILSHGYVFFTEIPTALLALWIYWRLQHVRDDGVKGALLIGVATGFLVLLHVRNIGLALALAALGIRRVRALPAPRAALLLGLAATAVCRLAVNFQFWGSMITTPHAQPGAWPGLVPLLSESVLRLSGLLFDQRHGLLPSAPMYLLAPAAWLAARRTSRTIAAEIAMIVGTYLLFVVMPITNVHGWRGGWSPAARFLVPVVPFLAVLLPWLAAGRGASPLASRVIAAVLAVQVALDAFFWAHPMLLWSEGPGPAPWLERWAGGLAARLPAWERLGPPVIWTSAAALCTWSVLTWTLARRAEAFAPRAHDDQPPSRPMR